MWSWLRPSYAAAAGVILVLAATGITLGVKANTNTNTKTSSNISAARAHNTVHSGVCEQLAVPAYFTAPYWIEAIRSKHPPADMILDISGVGAGNKPSAAMLYLTKKAQAAGITVLGYSSTDIGQRPIGQVEADVRNYASWYGVTSIFLDRVLATSANFSYYKTIANYIHAAHPGDQVWMNPGVYPDEDYMSIGDVMMVFEGTYAQYLTDKVPSWAIDYPAARFADTIYATPKAVLADALNTAELRAAGHIFVTDLIGSNPYVGLPSYWSTEDTDANVGCPGSG
jgi:hypothetical protein